MPIRINLLNEILAEEDMRRRDPVKRVAYLGAFFVALSLVWYSSEWLEFKMAQKNLSVVQDQIESNNKEYNRVLDELKKTAEMQKKLKSLQQLNSSRFLQGNLLNAIQQIYVPNVQLMRLKLDQSYAVKEAVAAQAGDNPTPARPGSSTERITLTLDAKDTSSNPGDQVNRYKMALTKLDFFKTNLQTNGIKLSNLSPPQFGLNNKPFVLFTLDCRFTDKTR